MPTSRTAVAPALAVLLLAGCNGSGGDEEQARSGEVLEGTISDAMLPLDTVRSQPPLADPEAAEAAQAGASPRAGGGAGAGGAGSGDATAPAPDEGSEVEAEGAEAAPEEEQPAPAEG